VRSLIVDSDRRGIATVSVAVTTAAGDAPRAVKALEDLDLAHRRGQEPRTLNFANAAEVTVDVMAAGTRAGRAAVRRTGLNARTVNPPIDPNELATDSPGGRGRAADPQAPPSASTFDLRSVFSTAGWFGDLYADLIPDQVDASVIVGDAASRSGPPTSPRASDWNRPVSRCRSRKSTRPSPILLAKRTPLQAIGPGTNGGTK
jgi:hypothetical protein